MKLDYEISADELALIENHLTQNLSPDEMILFEQKMSSDINWQHKIEEAKLLILGIQEAKLSQRLDQFHEQMTVASAQPRSKLFQLRTRWMVAASLLLVFSVAAWLLLSNKNEFDKLYAGNYTPDPGLLTAMGPASNYSFEKGMVDYKNEEYKKALQAWEALKAQGQSGDTLHYFLGMANQALGKYETAKTYLENIANDKAHPFYTDACWYMGLLMLKQKDKLAAISYIEKSTHPGKAAILNDLKKY